MKKISLVLIAMLLPCLMGNTQNKREPTRFAVLPFEDILGNGNTITLAFTQLMLSRLSREETLVARLAKPEKPVQVDRENAIGLGRKQNASLLLAGRIIDASTNQGSTGLPIPTLGRVNSQSVTAKIVAELEVISVATGKTLQVIRAEGKKTVRSNQTWVNSRLGGINLGGNPANASPMGQAMNECAETLVKRLRERSIEKN